MQIDKLKVKNHFANGFFRLTNFFYVFSSNYVATFHYITLHYITLHIQDNLEFTQSRMMFRKRLTTTNRHKYVCK